MDKKIYESKKLYSKKYNKTQSTLQIDKDLYIELKEYLKDKDISIRKYVDKVIRESFK
jgi:hypothetical protein